MLEGSEEPVGEGRVGGSHSAIVVAKWSIAGPRKLGLRQLRGSPRAQSLPQYYLHSEQDELSIVALLCSNCFEQVATARSPLAESFATLFNSRNPLLLDLCAIRQPVFKFLIAHLELSIVGISSA